MTSSITLPNDWLIAQLVGVDTYNQLVQHAPGHFRVFPSRAIDARAAPAIEYLWGGSNSAPAPLSGSMPSTASAPAPPNLVSTVLVDGCMSVEELRDALARSALARVTNGHVDPRAPPRTLDDPRIALLIGSSRTYLLPEQSMTEIVFLIVAIAALTALSVSALVDLCSSPS